MAEHEKYQRLIEAAKSLTPATTAVAHPCDESSLTGAVDAAKLGLIAPILVGPKTKIEATAAQFKLDISPYEQVDVPHSHAAAEKAVELVREGRAEALTKVERDDFCWWGFSGCVTMSGRRRTQNRPHAGRNLDGPAGLSAGTGEAALGNHRRSLEPFEADVLPARTGSLARPDYVTGRPLILDQNKTERRRLLPHKRLAYSNTRAMDD